VITAYRNLSFHLADRRRLTCHRGIYVTPSPTALAVYAILTTADCRIKRHRRQRARELHTHTRIRVTLNYLFIIGLVTNGRRMRRDRADDSCGAPARRDTARGLNLGCPACRTKEAPGRGRFGELCRCYVAYRRSKLIAGGVALDRAVRSTATIQSLREQFIRPIIDQCQRAIVENGAASLGLCALAFRTSRMYVCICMYTRSLNQ
jgi:hypothetical protein